MASLFEDIFGKGGLFDDIFGPSEFTRNFKGTTAPPMWTSEHRRPVRQVIRTTQVAQKCPLCEGDERTLLKAGRSVPCKACKGAGVIFTTQTEQEILPDATQD